MTRRFWVTTEVRFAPLRDAGKIEPELSRLCGTSKKKKRF
jgi:hypothetical protein